MNYETYQSYPFSRTNLEGQNALITPDQNAHRSIYYRSALKTFYASFDNFLLLSTTLVTIYVTVKLFLYFAKNFLYLLKIIICCSLLYFRLYVYVQELFSVSWENLHTVEHLSVGTS